MANERPITRESAMAICEKIRGEKARRIFSQCWGCVRFSKGDFSRMCASSKPDFRGCRLVNEVHDLTSD